MRQQSQSIIKKESIIMANIEFFKQQSKNLLKDYNSRIFNEKEGFYEYNPRYFHDIEFLIDVFNIDENNSFTLMNAQHIVSRLSGFYKWNELIKASEPKLEIGRLLLTNREIYPQRKNFFTNMVESLIVEDWKSYETQYLAGCNDNAKLEEFKKVFLGQGVSQKERNPKITLDFCDDLNAQDMLKKIMKEKNLSPEKAILSSISQKNCVSILSTGWAHIAVSLWGHANPYAEREKLDNPIIEIKLSKDKSYLLDVVMEKEKASFYEAILYFMIFTLESLGYHI